MQRRSLAALALLLAGCGLIAKFHRPFHASAQPVAQKAPIIGLSGYESIFNFPEPRLIGRRLTLWATHYNVYAAHDVADGYPLLDASGKPMGPRLSRKDWCEGTFEATIKMMDGPGAGHVYNYDSTAGPVQVDCTGLDIDASPDLLKSYERTRFQEDGRAWGSGVYEMQLVPYRSIAVDPKVIPFGSVLYIPVARGLDFTLPNGKPAVHDGYFFAADDGQTVSGNHIDVFTGNFVDDPMTDFIEDSPHMTFKAYIVRDPKILKELQKEHHWNPDELPD